MADNNLKSVGILISIAVACLMGAILVQIIAENTVRITQQVADTDSNNVVRYGVGNQVNETYWYHVSQGSCPTQTAWKNDLGSTCYIKNVVVTNSSGATLTKDTDYVLNETCDKTTGTQGGDFRFVNNSATVALINNGTTISYTYCGDQFIGTSWGRTVLDLAPGFFALAVLIGAAMVIYFVLRNEGIQINA